ncbi:MAG: DUF370 domain-containing protein [Oscillospiraceae bacterium]|nr:DUF370 domain-containing protein [Oscillospiraceae bacterium]
MLVMDSDHVVLSAFPPETILDRLREQESEEKGEKEEKIWEKRNEQDS